MNEPLKVALLRFPPFAEKRGKTFRGFEVDLWDAVAQKIGRTSEYFEVPLPELLQGVRLGQFDVGFGGLSATEKRERVIDFSHPTFETGLQILVLRDGNGRLGLLAVLRALSSKAVRGTMEVLVLFVLISAHVMWYAERNGAGPLAGEYWPAITNSLWWALVTLSTIGYGDYVPVTHMGRAFGAAIILIGLGIFALYIAEVSAAITLSGMRSGVRGKNDLVGKKVATVGGSVSEDALDRIGAEVVPVPNLVKAVDLLRDKDADVDAVVFDAPAVLRFVGESEGNDVVAVGGSFARHSYAFAFPEGDPLREEVNRTLLSLHEDGTYASLMKKWFGETL